MHEAWSDTLGICNKSRCMQDHWSLQTQRQPLRGLTQLLLQPEESAAVAAGLKQALLAECLSCGAVPTRSATGFAPLQMLFWLLDAPVSPSRGGYQFVYLETSSATPVMYSRVHLPSDIHLPFLCSLWHHTDCRECSPVAGG